MKRQSRAASGLSTDCPGSAVISRWKTLSASIAEAASVIAAGSVTRIGSVDITVNGRGVDAGTGSASAGSAPAAAAGQGQRAPAPTASDPAHAG